MNIAWLGRVPYREMWERQRHHREQVIAGRAEEVLWLLEHPPVVTLGRRGGTIDPGALASRGVEVVETERGGLATAHEPGQLVGYLIAAVGRRRWSVPRVIGGIEEGIIRWLAGQGVEAGRRSGAAGVWVGSDKIAAVGIHLRMGVTMHGFALNLTNDARLFTSIVPCGLEAAGVTALSALVSGCPTPEQAAMNVGSAVIEAIAHGEVLTERQGTHYGRPAEGM